jgi:redox-sensitive bicupin YhaK (pirin superfamily)
LVLPRIASPTEPRTSDRAVARVVAAIHAHEGAGFEVWRPFPGNLSMREADPFLLLDQMGPTWNEPRSAKGAPWHPHRGFETVTYLLDGEMAHHDSHGGGGVIGEGDTQWMTAGGGILHDELPSERTFQRGGLSHGVQLWVNLPARLKFTPPRYQPLLGTELTLLTSHDGASLVRLIAGDLAGHHGPGSTSTPITYAHATLWPGAELRVPWDAAFSAMVYVLVGRGLVGPDGHPLDSHQLAVFGPGPGGLTVRAADMQPEDQPTLEVLLLGGLPINEPIAHYGPFVMNTRQELVTAVEDFQAGRMGSIPAGG